MKSTTAARTTQLRGRSGRALHDWIRREPEEALNAARDRMQEDPSSPTAYLIEVQALRLLGDAAAAKTAAVKALSRFPGHVGLEVERAESDLALGDASAAQDRLEQVVASVTDFPPAWKALARCCQARGDEAGAERANRAHFASSVGSPELARAADLLQNGRLGQAEHALKRYLHDNPTDVSAIRLLADVALRLGVLEDARKLLERCLELAPDFHLARHDYANALIKLQRYEAAQQQLDLTQAAEPDNPAHSILQALLYVRIGELEKAVELYERILAGYPGQSKVQLSHGHALKTLGRQEAAIDAYRKAIVANPSFGEAYWSLANLKTARFTETDIANMQAQLENRSELAAADRYHLFFALGKALEDAGSAEPAFNAYTKGNAIRRKTIQYDADRISAERAAQEAFFTADFFEDRKSWGDPSPDPIFIVGLPRSGSTLQEQILASHSQVDGTFELPDIISIARRLSGKTRVSDETQYPAVLAQLSKDEVHALGAEYLERTRVHRQGAPYFIDKMPNNFMHIGLIKLILPNAKIIDTRRHPMACGFSNFKQLFARGQNFTYSLEEIGRYYRDYLSIMRHWDSVLPGQIHRVIYEQVIENSETHVRDLLKACVLDFEIGCVEFHQTKRAVRTASSEQVRQPIYTSGLEQWRAFEAFLLPLRNSLGDALNGDSRWDR